MDKGTALDGFFAHLDAPGMRDVVVDQDITTNVSVEYELVKKWQIAQRNAGRDPKVKGVPLGLMPELYPFDLVKRPLVEQANEFVRQIALKGYSPTTDIYSFEVWGPYTEKVGAYREFVPEADNQFIPVSEKKTAMATWLYGGDETRIDMGCVFRLKGLFTRKANLGYVEEKTGVLIV